MFINVFVLTDYLWRHFIWRSLNILIDWFYLRIKIIWYIHTYIHTYPTYKHNDTAPLSLAFCVSLSLSLSLSLSVSLPVCVQVLIELDSALLDDQPHWYKLQLHDVSSVPLPIGSPYLQRRGLQPEDSASSRRLQSETVLLFVCLQFIAFFCFSFIPSSSSVVDFVLLFSHDALPDKGLYYSAGNNICVCVTLRR